MIILDENIPESQRLLLRSWRIQPQQIGHEIGRQGMKDEEIIPLLHKLHRATLETPCALRFALLSHVKGRPPEISSWVLKENLEIYHF